MNNIQVTARFQIHKGKLDEFKRVADQCISVTKENDPNTLQYDWFFNPDQTECVVREKYTDSSSVFAHLQNLGSLFNEITGLADITIEVFGEPSEDLHRAAADLKPMVYSFYKGI